MEVRTPFKPTVFSAGGYNYLLYELHLQNFSDGPLALRSVEVFDAGRPKDPSIASFVGPGLFEKLVPVGADALDGDNPLEAGRLAVAFICLALDGAVRLPSS